MKYEGQIVLVTGAGNGIGRAIAAAFANAGASVIIADMDKESGEDAAQAIIRDGGKAVSFETDVSSAEAVLRLFDFINERYGRLDVLVNNVGSTIRKPIVHFTEEEWDFVYDTNVKSMFMCSKEAGKLMLRQRSGAVVNISSVHGLGGISRRLPYSSSKTAVESFTKTMACEWALDGVRVNAIAPGYILTLGMRGAFESGALSEEDMVRRTPQAHLGTPENIADAALFLCSEQAAFITGAILHVDGGYSAYNGPEAVPSFHHQL